LSSLRRYVLNDPDVCRRVRIVVLKEEAEKLVEELRKLGFVEVVRPREAMGRELELIEELSKLVDRGREIVDAFARLLDVETVTLDTPPTPDEIPKLLRELVSSLERDLDKIRALESRVEEARKRLEMLELVSKYLMHVKNVLGEVSTETLSYSGTILRIATFIGRKGAVDRFLDVSKNFIEFIARMDLEEASIITVACMQSVWPKVLEVARSLELSELTIPKARSIDEALKIVDAEIDRVRQVLALEEEIKRIARSRAKDVALLKLVIDNEAQKLEALRLALATKYLSVVEGWIPCSRYSRFVDYLSRTNLHLVVEEVSSEEEPPVAFNNGKIVRNFELITKLYGVPSPREWDPTPIFAYSFILFFALMLSDLGYAIGLILATRYVLPKFVDNPESEDFKRLQKVLYACGAATIVIGLLAGSAFGFNLPIPTPLSWMSRLMQLNNLLQFMILSLVIGFVHVILAHIIAAAKYFKSREIWLGISEIAIVLAMVFGAPVALEFVGFKVVNEHLMNTVFKPIALASLALIVISKIRCFGALGAMLWLFDITGALGDVLSYIRIAGVAAATVYMAQIFNSLALGIEQSLGASLGPIVGTAIGAIACIALLIIAHIFNLAIGCLGPFVHSLRLCLLEFGSKFFEGNGRELRPIKVVLTRFVNVRR